MPYIKKKAVDVDKMLSESEAGRGPRNLKEQTQMEHGMTRDSKKKGGQIPYKSYAPSGGISPRGDLGILDDKELSGLFPRQIKNANAEWRASQHLPMSKPRISGDETLTKSPHMYAQGGGTVYEQHWKSNHDGVRAGSRVAPQRRGVPAMTNQPVATFKAVGKFTKPIVNKKARNV